MTKIEFLDILTKNAKAYREDAIESIQRNSHMNQAAEAMPPSQPVVDALLVDFINFIGAHQGVDYALYTSDLTKP